MNIFKSLKKLMDEHGYTVKELARFSRVSESTIWLILSYANESVNVDRIRVGEKALNKVAAVFGMDKIDLENIYAKEKIQR